MARISVRNEDKAEMRAETESHLACRSEVWTEAEEDETEYWRKKIPEVTAKKRSGGNGRRGVVSEMRRERERIRKRNTTAADWKEVNRWTGVEPRRSGSASNEIRVWWANETKREAIRR